MEWVIASIVVGDNIKRQGLPGVAVHFLILRGEEVKWARRAGPVNDFREASRGL